MSAAPQLIVFEGIDGSGKTTISNRVAAGLRAHGRTVTHVRSQGRLASDVAESIREFTRDQRNLALDPFAELLLYTARESQQLVECVVPALARGEIVIADRFLHTPEVLARFGRGLARERVEPVLASARNGIEPDLTILIDVDPFVARARRRADKIARPLVRTSSRKGLAGASLMTRLREGYLELARSQDRWLVVDNTEVDLDALVQDLIAVILAGAPTSTARPPAPHHPRMFAPADARAALLGWLDRASTREPEVAAYLLGGLAGPGIDERRRALAPRAPAVIAAGLRGLDDAVSWELREALLETAPVEVARSLAGFVTVPAHAWSLRGRLAPVAPTGVAESLVELGTEAAWLLREELWRIAPEAVVRSLAGLIDVRAQLLRERWLARLGGERRLLDPELGRTLASSLRGVGDARAWELRLLAARSSPVGALLSVTGLRDERSWALRTQMITHAPRPTLLTLLGMPDEDAWTLRTLAGRTSKEVLDSILGMDDARAWTLREDALDRWPSTTIKSLGPLAGTERGLALITRQLARHPHDLSLLRHVTALTTGGAAARAVA